MNFLNNLKIDVNKLLYALVALGLAYFIYMKANSSAKRAAREKALQQFPDNIEAQLAAKLYSAIVAGLTEDEELAYSVARQMAGYKNFEAVRKTYKAMYNRDMVQDLQAHLDATEIKIFLDNVNGDYFPPDDWAERLHKALNGFWGEDEEAIYEVGREICPYDWARIERRYSAKFGKNLAQHLQSLLNADELKYFLSLVNSKKDCKNY